jgi:hypothetical protein
MIFISAETLESVVFFAPLEPQPPFGDLMKKSATLVTTALLTLGLAAASMAASPQSTTPTASDSTGAAPATKSHKHAAKKHKKSTAASTTK